MQTKTLIAAIAVANLSIATTASAQPGRGGNPVSGLLNASSNASTTALENPNSALGRNAANLNVLSAGQGEGLIDIDILNDDASLAGLEIADTTVINLIDGNGALGTTRPVKNSLDQFNAGLNRAAMGLAGPDGAVTKAGKRIAKDARQITTAVTGGIASDETIAIGMITGDTVNVSVGAINIGTNSNETLLDVDLLNTDTGNGGALGVAAASDGASGNGDFVGASVLGGNNAGNGFLLGAGALNGNNTGNSRLIGAAIGSGDNAGSGDLLSATGLSRSSGNDNDFVDAELITADGGNSADNDTAAAADPAAGLRDNGQVTGLIDLFQDELSNIVGQITEPAAPASTAVDVGDTLNIAVGNLSLGRNSDSTLVDIDVLNTDTGNKGQVGLGVLSRGASGTGQQLGVAVGGEDDAGQGGLAGGSINGGNRSGRGGVVGIAIIGGNNAGRGESLALGLLTNDNSGRSKGLGIAAIAGKNSGKGGRLGVSLLTQDHLIDVASGSAAQATNPLSNDPFGVTGIGAAINESLQAFLGNDGFISGTVKNELAAALQEGAANISDALAEAGLGDAPQAGNTVNLSVGTLDIGTNNDDTLLDVDVLNTDTGDQGSLGIGVISDGNSGSGSIAGLSVLGGTGSGAGGIAGVSVAGDDNSGTASSGVGAAIIGGDNSGTGNTTGVGVLTRNNSGTSTQGLGAGIASENNSGNGGALGVELVTADQLADISSGSMDNIAVDATTLPLSGGDIASRTEGLRDTLDTVLQSTLGSNGEITPFLENEIADPLQMLAADLTDSAAAGGLQDQPAAGESLNLSIGSFDIGTNTENTLLDIDVLIQDAGSQGSIGLALISDGASGSGELAGISVVGGDESGNGGILGASVIGGNGSGNSDNGIAASIGSTGNSGNGEITGLAVLGGDNSGNSDIAGAAFASGDNSAQGDLAGVGAVTGNNTAQGGSIGVALIGGDDSGAGDAAGIAIIGGDRAGTGELLGLGALSGANSGDATALGAAILTGPSSGNGDVAGLEILTADNVVAASSSDSTDIGRAINGSLQAVLGDNGSLSGVIENTLTDTLQETTAGVTDTLAAIGVEDNPAIGDTLNISVGTLDIGTNSDDTLLDVDVLNTDTGNEGALGLGILSDGTSGTGDVAGISLIGGEGSGSADNLALSVAGDDNSGTASDGLGIAIIGGDNAGTGTLAGIGILTGDNSATSSAIGIGLVTGESSATGTALGTGVISGDNSGQGTAGINLIGGDQTGTGGSIGLAVLGGNQSGTGDLLGSGIITGDNSGQSSTGPGIAVGAGEDSGTGLVGVGALSGSGSGASPLLASNTIGSGNSSPADSPLNSGTGILVNDGSNLTVGDDANASPASDPGSASNTASSELIRNPGLYTTTVTALSFSPECADGSDSDSCIRPDPCIAEQSAAATIDACQLELGGTIILRGVNFEFGTAKLLPESGESLAHALHILRSHPTIMVEIAGHTDGKGNAAANQVLSERRANAVRDYLVTNGIAPERLQAKGYGEDNKIAEESTQSGADKPDARQMNRRVEFKVIASGHTLVNLDNARHKDG